MLVHDAICKQTTHRTETNKRDRRKSYLKTPTFLNYTIEHGFTGSCSEVVALLPLHFGIVLSFPIAQNIQRVSIQSVVEHFRVIMLGLNL